MATIETAVGAKLAATSGVTDIVGSSPARIFAGHLPDDEILESITFEKIGAEREHSFGSDPGVAAAQFEVVSYAAKKEEAKTLAVAVHAALSRWSGSQSGVTILESFLEDERDEFDEGTLMHMVTSDFTIWHRE